MNPADFEAFISYFEENGVPYAELIKKILKEKLGITAFVAHIERSRYAHDFDAVRNSVIMNSKLFIFINTRDSLSRPEIIKEFQMAYPNGYIEPPQLIVFFHNRNGSLRSSQYFDEQIKFKLDSYNQQDFFNIYDLSSVARELFDEIKKVNFADALPRPKLQIKKENLDLTIPKRNEVFMGRQTESIQLKSLLESHNAVMVTGMGGIGKSTLVYHSLKSIEFLHFLYIPLTPKVTVNFLLDKFSKEFGKNFDTLDDLLRYLESREKVIIFVDNYEIISNYLVSDKQFIPSEIKNLHQFFSSVFNDKIKLIISSRNQINNLNVQIMELKGLSGEDGFNLFFKLLENNSFKIKNIPKSLVEDIVTEIEGHPLAIKLLANSYYGGGESELISLYKNINDLKSKLEVNLRDRSLRASFDYSFKKLSANNKELLLKMKTFKSPFSEAAFAYAFKDRTNNLHRLKTSHFIREDIIYGKTANESILIYDFHFLIRTFLDEKSPEGYKETEQKITEYYQKFINQTYSELKMGIFSASLKIADHIINKTPDDISAVIDRIEDPKSRTIFCDTYATMLLKIKHIKKSFEIRRYAIELDLKSNNILFLADDYRALSNCYSAIGNYDLGIEEGKNALRYYLQLYEAGDLSQRKNIVMMHLNLAYFHFKNDSITDLEKHLKASRTFGLDEDDDQEKLQLRSVEALLFMSKKDYLNAIKYFSEAMEIEKKTNQLDLVINDLCMIAVCYKRSNDIKMAENKYLKALEYCDQLDNPVLTLRCYNGLSKLSNDHEMRYRQSVKAAKEEIQKRGLMYSVSDLIL